MSNEIRLVDIRPLKKVVSSKFPTSSELRSIILQEDDSIPLDSFAVKVKVWFQLLEVEEHNESS